MLALLLFAATLNCPVLDATTVAAVYGEVQLTVSGKVCRFTRHELELTVEVTSLTEPFAKYSAAACPTSSPLKGIGNEAVTCSSETGRKIVSRIRNQAFILTLTTSQPSDPKALRALAEQVAGNLF